MTESKKAQDKVSPFAERKTTLPEVIHRAKRGTEGGQAADALPFLQAPDDLGDGDSRAGIAAEGAEVGGSVAGRGGVDSFADFRQCSRSSRR